MTLRTLAYHLNIRAIYIVAAAFSCRNFSIALKWVFACDLNLTKSVGKLLANLLDLLAGIWNIGYGLQFFKLRLLANFFNLLVHERFYPRRKDLPIVKQFFTTICDVNFRFAVFNCFGHKLVQQGFVGLRQLIWIKCLLEGVYVVLATLPRSPLYSRLLQLIRDFVPYPSFVGGADGFKHFANQFVSSLLVGITVSFWKLSDLLWRLDELNLAIRYWC